jgi:F5/8 type C domain
VRLAGAAGGWGRWARYAALGLILLLAIGLRLALLLQWPDRLNVDETIPTLMGLHILRGEFPAFWYEIAYQGAVEAYLTAVVYAVAGASPLTGKLAVFSVSCALTAVAFLTGRWMAGWSGGLLAALLVALGPPFLPLYGNYAMMGYMEVVVVGSVVLLLTLRLATDRPEGPRRSRALLVLGLVAGLGWWINPMIVSYLAAAGLFLLLTLRVRASDVPWAALGFGLGSLPSWLFNVTHEFWSFVLFRRGATGDLRRGVPRVSGLLLEILGVRGTLADPVPLISAAAGGVYLVLLGALVADLVRRRRAPAADARRRRGIVLFLLFATLHLVASTLTGQVASAVNRHLFPLYSAVPVLAGVALVGLSRWSRRVAVTALAILLLNNGLALAKTARFFEADRRADWWKPEPMARFLWAKGLTRAYTHERIAGRLTLETREVIVATDPLAERYRPYLRWVDESPRVAYVASRRTPLTPTRLGAGLRGIGSGYRTWDFGDFMVFYDFRPPSDEPLASLPPAGWRATADPPGSDPARAFDRDADSAWLSEAFIRPGMWYRLDLGGLVTVAELGVLPVRPLRGIPGGYVIEVSPDGTTWETVASVPEFGFTLRWLGGQPRMEATGRIVSRFTPRPVRYLRITQTGENPTEWWGVAELFVYTPSGRRPADPAVAQLLHEGTRFQDARRWQPALAAYEAASRRDPEDAEAYWRMVEVYDQARLPIEGSDGYGRARVFEDLELWARAAREYERLVDAEAGDGGGRSEPLTRLRALYRRLGQPDELARVERRLHEAYTPPSPADARFGQAVRLLGFGLEPREPRAGGEIRLAYYWQALDPTAENLAISVHFVRDGRIGLQQDHEPLAGRHPTSRWTAGELIREQYRIPLPHDLPPGEYAVRIGVWNPRTRKSVPVETSLPRAGNQVRLTTFRVAPPG